MQTVAHMYVRNLRDSQHPADQKSGENIVVTCIVTQPHLHLQEELASLLSHHSL